MFTKNYIQLYIVYFILQSAKSLVEKSLVDEQQMMNQTNRKEQSNNDVKYAANMKMKIKPQLNKLFMNKIRGWIQPQFSINNLNRTKEYLKQTYKVPLDCNIYNYRQNETMKISSAYNEMITQEVKKQIQALNMPLYVKMGVLWYLGLNYFTGSYLIKTYSKWGMLTASGRFQKVVVFSLILNISNYFLLDKKSDEIYIIFKHHHIFSSILSKYQQQTYAK